MLLFCGVREAQGASTIYRYDNIRIGQVIYMYIQPKEHIIFVSLCMLDVYKSTSIPFTLAQCPNKKKLKHPVSMAHHTLDITAER